MKKVQVFITPQQQDVLKSIARRKGISMSELLRRLIDEFLREPLDPREVR
jgi:hypothetical protein